MILENHYSQIINKSYDAFRELTKDTDRLRSFTIAHNGAGDLESLARLVDGRPEEKMFSMACLEYQHALYAVAFSQYRQAHMSLRLFFELSLGSILFSAHEIDAQLWLKGQKDTTWSVIISKENGVLSKSFMGAFFEEIKEYCDQYHAMATALYRECSEYVHGNRTSYDGIDAEFSFHKETLDAWIDRADTARLVVKFVFLSRYLIHARPSLIADVEGLALEYFSDIHPFKEAFNRGKA